jgi:hypothetical protein
MLRYKSYVWWNLVKSNWNVARNNVNVVVDELPSQISVYTCLTIDIWTRRRWRTSMRFYALRCHPPKMVGFQWKLAPKVFDFTMDTLARRKTLSEAIQRTQFCAKSTKNDLKPMDFLKRNFYFETEGVVCNKWGPRDAELSGIRTPFNGRPRGGGLNFDDAMSRGSHCT